MKRHISITVQVAVVVQYMTIVVAIRMQIKVVIGNRQKLFVIESFPGVVSMINRKN